MRSVVLAALIACEVGCSRPAGPQPLTLTATIANTFQRTYSVELRDGVVLYYNGPWGEKDVTPVKITPTRQQWADFRAALETNRVWQWHTRYDGDYNDGTGWDFRVQYSDRGIQSGGFNGFPDSESKATGPDPTPTFRAVTQAIERLLGGKPFRVDVWDNT